MCGYFGWPSSCILSDWIGEGNRLLPLKGQLDNSRSEDHEQMFGRSQRQGLCHVSGAQGVPRRRSQSDPRCKELGLALHPAQYPAPHPGPRPFFADIHDGLSSRWPSCPSLLPERCHRSLSRPKAEHLPSRLGPRSIRVFQRVFPGSVPWQLPRAFRMCPEVYPEFRCKPKTLQSFVRT